MEEKEVEMDFCVRGEGVEGLKDYYYYVST